MVDEAKLRVCCAVLSRSVGLTLCDPMDIGCQAPLSRQEYWSVLLCPPPGDLPDPGMEPRSPELQVGKPKNTGVGSLSLLQGNFWTQQSN